MAKVDEAVETIGAQLLPGLARLLDEAIDSAALARPGADAALHADRMRAGAGQLAGLARIVGAVAPLAQPSESAPPLRMSA